MDDLAIMIKQGFDEVDERFNGINFKISGLKKDVSGLKKDVSGLKKETKGIKKELKEFKGDNSREHAEMKLYLNNTAYKFEFVDLKKRFEKLEKKSML